MPQPAIIAENLSKTYRIAQGPPANRLSEVMVSRWSRLIHGKPSIAKSGIADFHALRDVSFTVPAGESLGIIGANGAGKSTLLKILTGVTEPSAGRFGVRGRVGSLLEVGTGFHPELTGRENIYLNGTILGMSRAEIRRRFDDIVEFADVNQFLDTPVKRYSSGMYMRLGFSIAAQLEPDVLIVDEVLAVGDHRFQKKCLGKLNEVTHGGRTVLFVTHNMAALRSFCQRAIWIDQGRICMDGPTETVVNSYLGANVEAAANRFWQDPTTAPGNEFIRLRQILIKPIADTVDNTISVHTPVELRFDVWNFVPRAKLHFSMVLCTSEDFVILNDHSTPDEFDVGIVSGRCTIPGSLLNDGAYSIRILVVKDGSEVLFDMHHAAQFEVHETGSRDGGWYGKWPGVIRSHFAWDTSYEPFS